MNRRVLVPLVVLVGLIGVGSLLEYTGRMGARSGTGRAAGLSGYAGGCAGTINDLPAEPPEDIELGMALPKGTGGDSPEIDGDADVIPGQFTIKFKDRPSIADLSNIGPNARLGSGNDDLDVVLAELPGFHMEGLLDDKADDLQPGQDFGLDRAFLLETDLDAGEVFQQLNRFQEIEWIEPVRQVAALGSAPNDPYYGYQWNMSLQGVPLAWDNSTGSGAIVAVVDTGVTSGPDGIPNLLAGYDFVDGDTDASDENGHGTHVAGTIAQTTNNGVGVAGMAPDASILPVRVLAGDGMGTTAGVAQGILWAANQGAHIINLSLGGDSYSHVLADAIDDVTAMGVLVVAATGNEDYQNFISFPGSLTNTLAVGATGLNQTRAPYSNRGPEIELSAPGGDLSVDADGDGYPDGILQETTVDGQTSYWFLEGTSMATPHVSAAAALLYGLGVTHPDEIRSLLLGSADDLAGTGWDSGTGYGGLNVVSALEAALAQLEQAEEEVEEEEEEEEEEEVAKDPETETPIPGEPTKGSEGKIWKVRVHLLNPYTATVRWMTTVPGTTEYSGLEGITVVNKELSLLHKVLVKVEQDVGEEITVITRFESPPNSMATATREIHFGAEQTGGE